jgi:hypothetical protein
LELQDVETEYEEAGKRERALLAKKVMLEQQHAESAHKAKPASPSRKLSADEPITIHSIPSMQFSLANLVGPQPRKQIPTGPKAMKRPASSPPQGKQGRPLPPRPLSNSVLNYEGFNDEAIRYVGGKRARIDPNGSEEQTNAAMTGANAESKPAVDTSGLQPVVNLLQLQRRIRELRTQQTTPLHDTTAQTNPPPVHPPIQGTLTLPDGVIPGITPNWENYLRIVNKDAEV